MQRPSYFCSCRSVADPPIARPPPPAAPPIVQAQPNKWPTILIARRKNPPKEHPKSGSDHPPPPLTATAARPAPARATHIGNGPTFVVGREISLAHCAATTGAVAGN
ncbi:uncharacterized protein N7482_008086 [Penicillium canariense]|uniref:Uncharacterized protein n=1 Tax=Penicillium canariense TaxID=189055 RepID=A0A9W9LH66_9EURO|nr:uncharacterized protein N7482_008086 [Penicillium canariense]KAJ5156986.1 hypothetical protein N7482_008086 [Penicillium canariense]